MKTKFLQYGITTVLGALLVLAVIFSKNYFSVVETKERIKIIADAFTVPGILLVCAGLLVFVTNEGVFHIFTYGIQSFANLFKKGRRKMKYATYYDYKESKKDQKSSFGFILFVGLFYLTVAIIFNIIWLNK